MLTIVKAREQEPELDLYVKPANDASRSENCVHPATTATQDQQGCIKAGHLDKGMALYQLLQVGLQVLAHAPAIAAPRY